MNNASRNPRSVGAQLLTIAKGEWLPEWLAWALRLPFAALAEATILFLLGVVLTLNTSEIQSARHVWLHPDPNGEFSVWGTVFWFGLFLWIVVFFLRRVAGDFGRSEVSIRRFSADAWNSGARAGQLWTAEHHRFGEGACRRA